MLNKLEESINKLLSTNIVKYGLVLLMILVTINVKKLSFNLLKALNSNVYLVIFGLVIVYFVYVDIVLALSLTLLVIVLIQEYNSRKMVINTKASDIDTGVLDTENKNNSNTNQTNDNKNNDNKTNNINNKYTELIPSSSYGSDLLYPDDKNTDEKLQYETQIGDLTLSSNNETQYSEADDVYQSISFSTPSNTNIIDKELFNNANNNIKTFNDKLTEIEYDHPASKTMTEMLRLKSVSLVDDEILNKLQTNQIMGCESKPCAVESVSCSFNAQSF